MKKVLLMMVLSGIIVFSSCSKKSDYTCFCVLSAVQDGVIIDRQESSVSYLDREEKNAVKLCVGKESFEDLGVEGVFTLTEENICTLSEK